MKIAAAMLIVFAISLPLFQGKVVNSEDVTYGLIDVLTKVNEEKSANPGNRSSL